MINVYVSVCVCVFQLELQGDQEVVVYDQSSSDPAALSSESFLSVLLVKLERSFPSVHLLSGQSNPRSLRHNVVQVGTHSPETSVNHETETSS